VSDRPLTNNVSGGDGPSGQAAANPATAKWRFEIVPPEEENTRLDRFLRRLIPGLGQGQIERMLRTGLVRLDGGKAKAASRLAAGQKIRLPLALEASSAAPRPPAVIAPSHARQQLDEMMLAEGKDWLALNKPSGLAVQGGTATTQHVDALLQAVADGPARRLRLVHRIDKDTSGILLLAKSVDAARRLTDAFQRHEIRKTYLALVNGVGDVAGSICAPLTKRGGRSGERMQVDNDGQAAHSLYRRLDHAGRKMALMALRPLTGRTHQLRVHMAHLGTPICGDGKYGGEAAHPGGLVARRLHLHAWQLFLPDGTALVAPLGGHMKASLDGLGMAVPAPGWRFEDEDETN
jgi:23S rRNA pseudouridine955/2504/2580 synthase